MNAREAIRNEYAGAAERYDDRWAGYLAETTHRTLAHVRLAPGERLLDVGCGTGVLLRAAGARFPDAHLIGADLSAGMLRSAQARDTPAALTMADAVELPVATASCNVVVTASSLHFWNDAAAGIAEIARVLRPDGRLALTDWCSDFATSRVIDRWLRWTGRASYHAVLGSEECARLLGASGFEVEIVERYHIGLVWGLMTITARRKGGS